MTSPVKPAIPPQAPRQQTSAAQAQTSSSGTTSPNAAGPAATGARSYASATKNNGTVVGSAVQNGKSASNSPVNGKTPNLPASATTGSSPMIVNGNSSAAHAQGDHTRKPSVTISAPAPGKGAANPNRASSIQFGQVPSSSPAPQPASLQSVSTPSHQRVPSPQTSPSPIPQPAISGGKPPSSMGAANAPSFLAADDSTVSFSFSISFICSHFRLA